MSRVTSQGVRDLNPPSRNGRKPQCQCRRNPQTATRVEMQVRTVTKRDREGRVIFQGPKPVGVHLCVFCGIERFAENEED